MANTSSSTTLEDGSVFRIRIPLVVIKGPRGVHPLQSTLDRERTLLILEELGQHLQVMKYKASGVQGVAYVSVPLNDRQFRQRLSATQLRGR